MNLKNLPLRKPPAAGNRIPYLEAKPGVTERIRGRAGMKQRERVKRKADYLCVACRAADRFRNADAVDHRVPLELGGSNDDSNLDALCHSCHAAKTVAEAVERGRRARGLV